jgi:hypothetical protein
MTAAIALALLAQGTPPALPAGTSPAFAETALAVEARLAAGDVAGARARAAALPVRTPRFAWAGDGEIAPAIRAGFQRAVQSWARRAPGFAPKPSAEAPELTIGFTERLPEGTDGLPKTAVIEPGPPFRATIGLARGKEGLPAAPVELNMEIAYVVGRYLGVNETPFPGTSMYRDARPGLLTFMPSLEESAVAAQNLDLADQLRAGIETGKPIGLAAASVALAKPSLDLGEAPQGKSINTFIEFENKGAGGLDFRIQPDCNCFTIPRGRRVLPGEKVRVPVLVDTSQFVGQQDKVLLFLSNDPLRPAIQIPVSFRSRPAYRLYRPGGENFLVSGANGGYDVYLFPSTDRPFRPTAARLEGIPGKVTWAAWSGSVADPEMAEGALPRKGWRFRVQLPADLPPGRVEGSLAIDTTSATFGTLQFRFTAQKGIVSLPESTYFGDIVAGSRASFLVSRPDAPFGIKSIDAGPFKASWHAQRNGSEYRIDLVYVGGQPKGEILIPVRIRTDDPKQPLVEALVSGNIK